MMTGP
ncbi:rCG49787, partial [Rattus norvegicus]